MDFLCKKCNNHSFYLQARGFQVGIYCDNCGSWGKWVGKKEIDKFKRAGYAVLPQNATVTLKQTYEMGVEKVDNLPNMGLSDNVPFGSVSVTPSSDSRMESSVKQSDLDIEAEIERRVSVRLAELENNRKNEKNIPEEISVEEGFCPICDGNPLVSDGNSRVEVSIFSGVMTVTDPDGLNIYGLYKLKRCPYCGKLF